MRDENQPVVAHHPDEKLKLASYISGFGLSIILTLAAYLVVVNHAASRNKLIALVAGLAFVQFIVQIYFFLHLGKESKPRWKLGVFFFMIGVVLILVVGSLWIMYNLNYRMSLPQQLQYMNNQDDL